jgi:peptidoglycan/xylan/chitin deacetylase (PgdA/CDA1 family)
MGLTERERAVQRLLAMLRCPSLRTDLMMRRDQVRELHRAGMEVGAHTVRHPILMALPPEQAWKESSTAR